MTPEQLIAEAKQALHSEGLEKVAQELIGEVKTLELEKDAGAEVLKQGLGTFIRHIPGTFKFKIGNLLGDARGTYKGILKAEGATATRAGQTAKSFADMHVEKKLLDEGLAHTLKSADPSQHQAITNIFRQKHAARYQKVEDAAARYHHNVSTAPVPTKTHFGEGASKPGTVPLGQMGPNPLPEPQSFTGKAKVWIQNKIQTQPLATAGVIGGTALGGGLLAGHMLRRQKPEEQQRVS